MDDKSYTVGKWHEQDNYKCKFCPFATTSEAKAIEHYQLRHVHRPTPSPPSPILVADKSGHEVKPTVSIKVPESTIAEAIIETMAEGGMTGGIGEVYDGVDSSLGVVEITEHDTPPAKAKTKPPAKRRITRSKDNG